MREWLVIEDSRNRSPFYFDDPITGYIPRDVMENELGIKIKDGWQWFTIEERDRMMAHPEWRTTLPPGAEVDGPNYFFWGIR